MALNFSLTKIHPIEIPVWNVVWTLNVESLGYWMKRNLVNNGQNGCNDWELLLISFFQFQPNTVRKRTIDEIAVARVCGSLAFLKKTIHGPKTVIYTSGVTHRWILEVRPRAEIDVIRIESSPIVSLFQRFFHTFPFWNTIYRTNCLSAHFHSVRLTLFEPETVTITIARNHSETIEQNFPSQYRNLWDSLPIRHCSKTNHRW